MIPENARFLVRGFDAKGRMLLETWHTDHASANMEAQVWSTRIKNKYDRAARCEVQPLGGGRKIMSEAEFLKTSWRDWRE